MRPLDERQRKRLLTWSALFCAIPICLAPLAGRSSFELAVEQAAFDARFSAPQLESIWNDKPVPVARDPFVAEAPAADSKGPVVNGSVVGMRVVQGESTGIALAGNRLSAGIPLTVTAVITGASARALVDDGERVRVVGIGDALAGSRVVSIDGEGVRLQSGLLLPLAEDRL